MLRAMSRTVKQLFDLTGKTALITGGSRGLGLQMALACGEAGAKVVISSRKATDLESASAALKSRGISCEWIAADCAHETQIDNLVDETMKRMDRIDILINNAGATWGAPAEEHPLEAWDKVLINVLCIVLLISEHAGNESQRKGLFFVEQARRECFDDSRCVNIKAIQLVNISSSVLY
jgi:NAD(P)-dependent dehydrogenase (short-subunit alcohol dehydrogenase family)